MRVVFDEEALDDLRRIFEWIAKENRPAAERLIRRLFDRIERLAEPQFTHAGRPGLDPGTRELIEYPYVVVYEVNEDRQVIIVLSVVHGAQDRKLSDE